MFIEFKPDPKRDLDCGREKTNRIQRDNAISEQFKRGRGGAEARGSEMNWKRDAVQKPCGDGCRADQDTSVGRQPQPPECGSGNAKIGDGVKRLAERSAKKMSRAQFNDNQTEQSVRAESG